MKNTGHRGIEWVVHVNVLVHVNVNVPETGVMRADGIDWKAWLQSL